MSSEAPAGRAERRRARASSSRTTWRRRLLVLVPVAVVVLVAAVVGVVQVRAERAAAERADLAAELALVAAEQDRIESERERRAAEALAELRDGAQGRLDAARAARADGEAAQAQVAEAGQEDPALDDAVAALTAAITLVEAELAEDAERADAGALESALGRLDTPTAGLAPALQGWHERQAQLAAEAAAQAEAEAQAQAEAEARAQAAAARSQHPSTGAPWTAGAGPDCGGPESYEPSKGGVGFDTSTPAEEGDGSNGRIPRSQLAALHWCEDRAGNKQWLVPAAADALTRLNEAFHATFGENIAVDLSYRSIEDQVAMREYYGGRAAVPGTSNHGWGTAIDVWEWEAYSFGSARYEWLVANAPAHGWVAPDWARQNGSNPEYWHFEYVG